MTRARRQLVWFLAALFAAMLVYKVLHAGHLEQTALFYVGLPAVIALAVAIGSRPKSVTGTALAAVTIGLALAGPLLDEGVVCLIMAAPLFYLMAVLIAAPVDWAARRARRGQSGGGRAHAFATVPLIALLALEGSGAYDLPRDGAASVTRTVAMSPGEFERALAAPPRFAAPEPVFLQIPFPRPQRSEGAGLAPGDHRQITFNPHRSLGIGSHPTPRGMRLVVAEHTPGRAVFTVARDTTLARWLDLRSAAVTWRPAASGRTEVTWTLRYRRTFDPGWYFGPLQQYGMEQAAAYLSDTFSRPAAAPAGPVAR
ncbi:hypothetical protein ADL22_08100 [Streptomyces sp. NRRL F-4489]|uniref:hypothetical protein n=1 Tax=Streptomyces sp. NRRL F-4489 TaxID=1609095 RepID=UPI000748DAF2|nr:hypothetical protein [Streptomyces sp. NRRL F-4489]KUL49651.1 hypothetical protein ADL22_08100 [Streptomyces sp. NRRL F-4489]